MEALINRRITANAQTYHGKKTITDCAIVAESKSRVLIFKEESHREILRVWAPKNLIVKNQNSLIINI